MPQEVTPFLTMTRVMAFTLVMTLLMMGLAVE
jgi:hypothetical protein